MEEKRSRSKAGQSESVQGAMLDKYVTLRNLGKGVIGTSLWTLGIILGAAGVVGIAKNDDDKYVIKLGPVEINIDNIFGSSTFLAGAALVGAIKDGKLVTSGGRVLNICATGDSLDEVREKVYKVANKIDFDGKFYRNDIGLR